MTSNYHELRTIVQRSQGRTAFAIGSRTPVAAAKAMERHGVDEASDSADQLLLAACRDAGDDGAFLCLRCRVSHPLEQKLLGIHRQFSGAHDLDLIALASYALDDDGRLLNHNNLLNGSHAAISPFTAEVICSYQSGHGAGLPHWARVKIQAHNGLKSYLREHGLLMISSWALLADTSARRVREALQMFGSSALTSERALALHTAYCQAYPAAKADYRQLTGRQSGWVPSDAFLLMIAPELRSDSTREQLEAISTAVRTLLSGKWQRSRQQADGEADLIDSLVDPASAPQGAAPWTTDELLEMVKSALARSMDPAVRAALSADQPRWQMDGDRRLAWQLYGEGLGQREIADRCCHQQGWVSKLLREKTLATTIATAAAVELRRHQAFASVCHSVEGAERLVEALRNHPLTPERDGDIAPLRHAIAAALTSFPA